jgi:hypothetical protein
MAQLLRFEFHEGVSVEEIKDLVAVAETACEGLTGRTALMLEAPVTILEAERAIEVNDASEPGRALSRVLARLAERGIGAADFTVRRVDRPDGGLARGTGRWGGAA